MLGVIANDGACPVPAARGAAAAAPVTTRYVPAATPTMPRPSATAEPAPKVSASLRRPALPGGHGPAPHALRRSLDAETARNAKAVPAASAAPPAAIETTPHVRW